MQTVASEYWYGKPGVIERWFCGVFEGGGAKGVAYSGALRAMKDARCWFDCVAGASAGAITAALIASGLSAEQIDDATGSALSHVRTGVWAGLRRLQEETGYFSSTRLMDWLDDTFRSQVALKSGSRPNSRVTFSELFAATGIELNIVAANLSLKCQVVFSHLDTPNCAVADAVVASSSIPFAFPSRLLQVLDKEIVSHHTLVDGGVWSNFPMFIFEDAAFRESYQRIPAQVSGDRILGFVLKEEGGAMPPRGESVVFVNEVSAAKFRAREWGTDADNAASEMRGLAYKFGAALLYPLSLLGRLAQRNGGVERGRWPDPPALLIRRLVQSIDGMLAGIHPILFGVLACVIVGIGAYQVIHSLGAEQPRVWLDTDWTDPKNYFVRPVSALLAVLAIAITILFFFSVAFGVVVNHLLLRAFRRILYGLVTTYVAGPGAPEWITKKKNIVALPIQKAVTTLSFDIPDSERAILVESAYRATLTKLEGLSTSSRGVSAG